MFEPGLFHPAEFIGKEADVNGGAASKSVPDMLCPDCKKSMRVLTLLPALNGLWDLSYKCDQCGKVSDVVHRPEDK